MQCPPSQKTEARKLRHKPKLKLRALLTGSMRVLRNLKTRSSAPASGSEGNFL